MAKQKHIKINQKRVSALDDKMKTVEVYLLLVEKHDGLPRRLYMAKLPQWCLEEFYHVPICEN